MSQVTKYDKLPESVTQITDKNIDVFYSESSLDWYKLTELTRYTLNHLLVATTKKLLEERLQIVPNENKLKDYQRIINILTDLSRDPKNFESKDRMKMILEEYSNLEIL